jgi:hypothetical protein
LTIINPQNYLAGKLERKVRSTLEKKNKPKVIYFYKELFRLTYEKTFALLEMKMEKTKHY